MAPGAVRPRAVAAPNNVVLPEQWTATTATVAATLAALKNSLAAPPTSPPVESSAPPRAPLAELPAPQAPRWAPVTTADGPLLPTRRSLREAAERNAPAPTRRSRAGLFTRLLTVRAFRSGHTHAKGAGAPSEAVGTILDAAGVHGVLTLHQLRVPGQRGRIEHLAVSAWGVHVVDVLHFKNAAIELRPTGVAGSPVELVVGGRVMTTAAAATARRVAGIRSILAAAGLDNVRVTGALCFVDGLLPLGVNDLALHGVHVLRPSTLTALVTRSGSLDAEHVLTLQEYLARHLPKFV
jgi:hypothetical protein